jgi:apolipoprotein N-acyltransferase
MALLWLSFPPVGLWWLAWCAPVPLIGLCAVTRMPGIRPYRSIWLAGLLYWLATFYFIPIPHWALWFGWLTVSLYMSLYTILFVGAARMLVHHFRVPMLIAVPVTWTGVEWIRCVFLTGMGMACLSHSQFEHPLLIQVADLCGAYTLTFSIVLFATSLFGLPVVAHRFGLRTSWSHAAGAIISLALVLAYGQYRLYQAIDVDQERSIKIALIQGSVDTDLAARQETMDRKFDQYCQLTWQARRESGDIDLIVWPEGNLPYLDVVPGLGQPTHAVFDSYEAGEYATAAWQTVTGFPEQFETPVAFLSGTLGSYGKDVAYNSVVLFDKQGDIVDRYFKNHRVMFGEYFPILEWFPSFSQVFASTTAGTQPESFEAQQVKFAPSICFETTVPQLIRRQVNQLAADGNEPDALVNLTNDGWFYGTSCLDFHLACNVFRAVEMRKPNLVCANTGFSAEIDSCGRILQRGPRRDVGVLLVDFRPVKRNSLYRVIGDAVPIGMGVITLVAAGFGWRIRKNS